MQETGDFLNSDTKAHYKNHLAPVYSWISGDFREKSNEQYLLLSQNSTSPQSTGIALDLGSGHGIHSMALAKCGFSVIAVDFNAELLTELKQNLIAWGVHTICGDIRNITHYSKNLSPEVVLCGGDTITHLNSHQEAEQFISDISGSLYKGGKLIISFRDYSTVLSGDERFIPVKSDKDRIFTCILDFEQEHVRVTDMLYEREGDSWQQKISSYYKLRLAPAVLQQYIESYGFTIDNFFEHNRMIYILASKTS